jgi:ribosome maturation factor RimP
MATPNKFSQFTEYYIEKEGGNRIDEIETSNRKILKVLDGEDKEKIKAYLKENKIKVRSIEDLKKIIEVLNS